MNYRFLLPFLLFNSLAVQAAPTDNQKCRGITEAEELRWNEELKETSALLLAMERQNHENFYATGYADLAVLPPEARLKYAAQNEAMKTIEGIVHSKIKAGFGEGGKTTFYFEHPVNAEAKLALVTWRLKNREMLKNSQSMDIRPFLHLIAFSDEEILTLGQLRQIEQLILDEIKSLSNIGLGRGKMNVGFWRTPEGQKEEELISNLFPFITIEAAHEPGVPLLEDMSASLATISKTPSSAPDRSKTQWFRQLFSRSKSP